MREFAPAPSHEQKEAAVNAVLESEAFARCDQLKSFLRYVCELEIAGRGDDIKEYLIGVEALGRPDDYSPGDDSAVRSRAYALRRKLQEFYDHELPDAPIRIELPKGSYRPRFVECQLPAKSGDAVELATPAPSLPILSATPLLAQHRAKSLALAFLAGMLLASAIAWSFNAARSSQPTRPGVAPILSEAWSPLLEPDTSVLVCVATPVTLFVRQFETPSRAGRLLPDTPTELYNFYREHHPLSDDGRLYMLPTFNSPLWGDAVGALIAVQTLSAAGAAYQVLPERVVSISSMRGKNIILLGTPEYSEAVARLLQRGAFYIGYSSTARDQAILNREPRASEREFYTYKRDDRNEVPEVYGLITVLPSEGTTDTGQRTVIISGITSAGTQAAAEFYTSPHSLLEFKERLKAEGHASFPRAYQIIVKATASATLPMSFAYETHRVLQ